VVKLVFPGLAIRADPHSRIPILSYQKQRRIVFHLRFIDALDPAGN